MVNVKNSSECDHLIRLPSNSGALERWYTAHDLKKFDVSLHRLQEHFQEEAQAPEAAGPRSHIVVQA
jgi:hypothetical protein